MNNHADSTVAYFGVFVLFALSAVACTFSCMMKFTVKDCDPNTGEADVEGYEDEYVVRRGLWLLYTVYLHCYF